MTHYRIEIRFSPTGLWVIANGGGKINDLDRAKRELSSRRFMQSEYEFRLVRVVEDVIDG